ncbi:hypothetical protein [Roseovarius aestuarii]|uniref:DUF1311 domain-containing protein n=1 Tax=Roseovarius aestuarii TaxID=475083 RepID=A0A1X7BXQ7_9RHOB|nr:hypothetical protein [Roseovarius aestuarii]SMC14392.1 hypothetical protein ROA7745_04259 [Roseovarius aestuarii]
MCRLILVIVMLAASNSAAQEACIEPVRPDAGYLADAGYGAGEIRSAYRSYFSDVENYLNCYNQATARIRQEATVAARDYDRVLDRYPVEAGQGIEPEQAHRIEMSDSGTLFLNHQAEWLK